MSGRDYFVDAQGEKLSASRWLLDVIAGKQEAAEYRIFPIVDPQLLDKLEFDKDPRVRRFLAGGKDKKKPVDPPRFSVRDLEAKFQWIDKESKRIQQSVKWEDYNDYHRSLSDLRGQLQGFIGLTRLHQFPDLSNIETFKRTYQGLDRIDRLAMFQMVPEAKGQWQTNLRAGVMLRVNEVLKKELNPAAQSLQAILAAYALKEGEQFNHRLAEYRKWVEMNGVTRSPVTFSLPKTWREAGVRNSQGDQRFDSVIANGETVAEFDIGEGKQAIKAYLRHFTGKTMPDTEVYNDWRIGFGLMPLSKSELAKTGAAITIAGHKVFYVDLSPSPEVETTYKRIVGSIVRHGKHTFLITAGLPENVTHHINDFEMFARSLKFAAGEELSRWFPDSKPGSTGRFPDDRRRAGSRWKPSLVVSAFGLREGKRKTFPAAGLR